jgi:hypothetical protein
MPTSAFEYFLGRRNARVVSLLERNEGVAAMLQGLLEHLVDVAEERGVPFEDLVVDRPFVHGEYLKARIQITR